MVPLSNNGMFGSDDRCYLPVATCKGENTHAMFVFAPKHSMSNYGRRSKGKARRKRIRLKLLVLSF